MVTLFLFVILGKYLYSLLRGETFIPTWVYDHLVPWRLDHKIPWNVLSADGLFEFLPWRQVVMESVSNGVLPLVNPYAASTLGGQPLLANGQSGFFYPLHWPFWFLPQSMAATTLTVSVFVHVIVLSVGTFLLARTLTANTIGAVVATIGFSQSATVISWLPLATHLTVIAWLPWMWLAVIKKSFRMLLIASVMSMLAGHLQLAMYSLLTTGLIAIAMSWRERSYLRMTLAIGIGVAFSLCQLLPSLELGQQSHRGGVAASTAGYEAYISNAMPFHHLITWLVPNYFGSPNLNAGNAWILTPNGVPNNYAEWALYTGILVPIIFFAGLMSYRCLSRIYKVILLISILAATVALGSPICMVMYYGIPGFAATGNPARVLPILSLAVCVLAGASLSKIRLRHVALSLLLFALLMLTCNTMASRVVTKLSLPSDVTSALSADAVLSQLPIAVLSLIVVGLSIRLRNRFSFIQWSLPAVLLLDLWMWSSSYHPVAYAKDAIRSSSGIDFLKQRASNDPIACIVGNWSLGASSPQGATLPPNLLTLHQLHDIAVYDSLLIRDDKNQLESLSGTGLMPPENGNLMRIPSIEVASSLGAVWVVLEPSSSVPSPDWEIAYTGEDMTILHSKISHQPLRTPRKFSTTALRFGMYVSLFILSILIVTYSPKRAKKFVTI